MFDPSPSEAEQSVKERYVSVMDGVPLKESETAPPFPAEVQ